MSTDTTASRTGTVEFQEIPAREFIPRLLPWVLGAGGLAVYLLTLNHWVSFRSLGHVARVSGWMWQVDTTAPLYWLLTLPFHWLPVKLVPLGFNLFSAVCAGLVLVLLARSVALLPHDRTKAQRERERSAFALLSTPTAWVPPLLAVLICGLQLSFWESATAATTTPGASGSGHMLDLLLFAYVIRCLLEYRLSERDSWLTRASFVYALGMANDWAMIAFFPCFIVTQIWMKGLSFFNSRFLGKMFLWGCVGLLLYFLLPAVFAAQGTFPFWMTLKSNFIQQKNLVLGLPFNSSQLLHGPDPYNPNPMIVLGLTSLLPILLIGIRWTSYFGDTSPTGARLAKTIFHVVHGLFLIACVWIMLDPPVSPRNKGAAYGLQFLSLYYLAALSAGYFSGYFLLVFGKKPAGRFAMGEPDYMRVVNGAIVGGVFALLILAPVLLLYRNLPQIRFTNGPMLAQYSKFLTQDLPSSGAVVVSDDTSKLLLAQAWLAHEGKSNHIFVDTPSLQYPRYHLYLQRLHDTNWPISRMDNLEGRVTEPSLLTLVAKLSVERPIYYLHPSFGYYFEAFYLEPTGMVYRLRPYTNAAPSIPPLRPEQIRQNEEFWNQVTEAALVPLANNLNAARAPGILDSLAERTQLTSKPSANAQALASMYSAPLVYWGTTLQKQGMLTNAAARFDTALELKPDNIVAQINLDCNKSLQKRAGKGVVPTSKELEEQFERNHSWGPIIMENGPFDEAGRCHEFGVELALGRNFRQAKQQFLRAQTLDPENFENHLALAEVHLATGELDAAIQLIRQVRADAKLASARKKQEASLLFVEASAELARTNDAAADTVIWSSIRGSPGDELLAKAAMQAYIQYGRLTNALDVANEHLKIVPESPVFLSTKGYLLSRFGAYSNAIPLLSRVLESATDTNVLNTARLNRAIAYFKTDNLDKAKVDYESLRSSVTNLFQVYYGLAEIAYRKKETAEALRNYELYVNNAPPQVLESAEGKHILERLQELRSARR